MDVLQKLRQLQQERGWSDYRIAKEAKLSPNTVSNIFRRGTLPSVSTLEALCGAFGITVAQFFAQDEMVEVSPEVRELLKEWKVLTDTQRPPFCKSCGRIGCELQYIEFLLDIYTIYGNIEL